MYFNDASRPTGAAANSSGNNASNSGSAGNTGHSGNAGSPGNGGAPGNGGSQDNGSSPSAPGNGGLPAINLPKGGGAIKGIDEKFSVNATSGTSSCSIAIPFSSSRNGNMPPMGLAYNSGGGNSPYGIGWQVGLPSIMRKTDNGLPRYQDANDSDTFVLSGTEDLVPLLQTKDGIPQRQTRQATLDNRQYTVTLYRPRIESAFVKIEKWQDNTTGDFHWRTISKENSTSYFGMTAESRICDPADNSRVFQWLLCRNHDDKGSIVVLSYKKEDFAGLPDKLSEKNRGNNCTQTYLKQVAYGNRTPYYLGDPLPGDADFMFRAIWDYGEHDASDDVPADVHLEKNPWATRKDPFSSYSAGFDIRTYRRCRRIMMFHCFPGNELPLNPYLVSSLQLFYDETLQLTGNGGQADGFSFLTRARQNGHIWSPTLGHYTTKYLPELELQYQQHEWNTTLQYVTPDNVANAPAGIDNKSYLWTDLFSEGIGGILTEQADQWYYKSNLGNGQFTNAALVMSKPSLSGTNAGLSNAGLSLEQLEGDGVQYLVQGSGDTKGFFRLSDDNEWAPMRSFEQYPVLDPGNPNVKYIDLNGDKRAEILYTDENSLRWYPGLGEKGFDVHFNVVKELDEEKGPAIVFSDPVQSIFLADMSGDGLTDIVRIRNGEVCYWPNKGYGHFGAKVSMDNAPVFDTPDNFNPAFLRLADIDGTGTTDIVYLGKNNFSVWLNNSGNGWAAAPQVIAAFPPIDDVASISVLDFLGTGTATIVYSSPLTQQPIQYIDLMGSKKPALLSGYKNNCGKEVRIEYKTSTQYYLADKLAGIPWISKLPFPVHVISRLITEDKVRETIFTNTFSYRHGYYDFSEKEFRGFARVEKYDTESFEDFSLNTARNVVDSAFFQPPVRTVSWFHTGAWLPNKKILHQCESEYFTNELFAEYDMPDPVLPSGLSADELREALRACKGLQLRTEMYSADGSALAAFPYQATQTNGQVRLIQAKAGNKYASFLLLPSESITYSYERIPADPRIAHTFTLESDEFGNMTKTAMVIYPRVARPGADGANPTGELAIPDKVWNEQNKMHISYGESVYTNDILQDDIYRLRVLYQSKGFEVSGLAQPANFYFTTDGLSGIAGAAEIPFEAEFSQGLQKRLTASSRIYFRKDDLSGPLPLGILPGLGMLYQKYQLVFTPGLVQKYYGTQVTDDMLTQAMYVHSEGDDNWWAPSSLAVFPDNPAANFYIAIGSKDLLGQGPRVQFDAYHLLVQASADPLGNIITAVNDYRQLSPIMVTDPNLNRSAVATNELGFVISTAMMGKEGAGEGDTLADPTTRLEFDLFNWQNNGKPNFVHTFLREQHGAANTRWQETYAYSDGGGGVIMTKQQANPGKANVWDPVTLQVDEVDANPRWVGNGRVIYNNKGNIIRSYDPYFSTNPDFESADQLVQTGVSVVNYYDPVGRVIKSVLPNGTFSKIEFDSWFQKSFDVNDTVKDSQWYIDRGSPDPLTQPEPADPETRAAWLAAKHYNTPTVIHSDSMGRPFMTVTDLGGGKSTSALVLLDALARFSTAFDPFGREISFGASNMTGASMYSRIAEKGEKWMFQDAMNRIVKLWNGAGQSSWFTYDKANRDVGSFVRIGTTDYVVTLTVYGDVLPSDQAIALNMKGRKYQVYDQSGVIINSAIDFKGNSIRIDKRLTAEYKQMVNWVVLDGLTDITAINAAAAPLLETETFSSIGSYDALNRPQSATLPDNSVVNPSYNEANQVQSLDVQLQGQGAFINFFSGQDFNARGQRQFAKYGNGSITRYFYDPLSFRLTDLVTSPTDTTDDTQALQKLHYTYDPVGNIAEFSDAAQQTYFFRNAVVFPDAKFEYAANYQLLKASGREHAGLGMDVQRDNNDIPFIGQLPEANDSGAVRNYTEQYVYDDCGNILSLQHIATGASWTQRYRYQYQDDPTNNTNRLRATSLPGDADGVFSAVYSHSADGNISSMPHLPAADSMVWNFAAQLKQVNLGGGGMAYYVYDAGSKRNRKVIERIGGKKIQRIYLGAVEIYRESQGAGTVDLQRYTLSISDNTGRIAQVDTKTIDVNNSDPGNGLNQPNIRYQYGNHVGSASLETDETGQIISYEEYHPFGTSSYRVFKPGVDTSLKRYRFTGKEHDDETGFYCFDTRYYAAWLGRWTSHDPGGFLDTLNLWVYCSNNPVNFIDPDGLDGKHKAVIVPKSVHTAAQFDAWASSHGIWYTGTPVKDKGGWHVDYWGHAEKGTAAGNRTPQSPPPRPEGSEGGSKGNTPPPPDATAQGEGAPAATKTEALTGPAAAGNTPAISGLQKLLNDIDANEKSKNSGGGTGKSGPANGGTGDSGTGKGSGSGSGKGFFSRGWATLITGLLLLGAGLLTIFTAGGATPLLILASGAMATAGGVAVTTSSVIQLGFSYGGVTTAQQDIEMRQAIGTAASISSPGGLTGGAIGTAVNGESGLHTGALLGAVTELGATVTIWRITNNLANNAPGTYSLLTQDANIAQQAATYPSTVPNAVQVISSHGLPGLIEVGGKMQSIAELTPVLQSSPHRWTLLLACSIAKDPAAVQALANESGKAIGAFDNLVGAASHGNFWSLQGGQYVQIAPRLFNPQTWSPFTSAAPNATAAAASTAANAENNLHN